VLIRARRIAQHRAMMLAALGTSALFLVCYVVYHAQVGSGAIHAAGVRVAGVFHDSHHARHARGDGAAAGDRHRRARPARRLQAAPEDRAVDVSHLALRVGDGVLVYVLLYQSTWLF
jgi:hypothetical protein